MSELQNKMFQMGHRHRAEGIQIQSRDKWYLKGYYDER